MTSHDSPARVDQEIFWVTRSGFRWWGHRSRQEADAYIASQAEELGGDGWAIEVTLESLPLVRGELVRGGGEVISLDDDCRERDRRRYEAVHIFWKCPHCGLNPNERLYADPVERLSPHVSPALWSCEREVLLVLVSW